MRTSFIPILLVIVFRFLVKGWVFSGETFFSGYRFGVAILSGDLTGKNHHNPTMSKSSANPAGIPIRNARLFIACSGVLGFEGSDSGHVAFESLTSRGYTMPIFRGGSYVSMLFGML